MGSLRELLAQHRRRGRLVFTGAGGGGIHPGLNRHGVEHAVGEGLAAPLAVAQGVTHLGVLGHTAAPGGAVLAVLVYRFTGVRPLLCLAVARGGLSGLLLHGRVDPHQLAVLTVLTHRNNRLRGGNRRR